MSPLRCNCPMRSFHEELYLILLWFLDHEIWRSMWYHLSPVGQVFFFFFEILFLFFYRIKYIYLNTITFTQIITSRILRKRLSDSLWKTGMENMLRQIGNLFYTLSNFVWLSSLLFSIIYYIFFLPVGQFCISGLYWHMQFGCDYL